MTFFEYRLRLWRGTPATDGIDYTKHDKRFHHGNFDPKTMRKINMLKNSPEFLRQT